MTAREQLAEAHKIMTPEEIAAHALSLAELLEAADLGGRAITENRDSMITVMVDQGAVIDATRGFLEHVLQLWRTGHRARARAALESAVAQPPTPSALIKINYPAWPDMPDYVFQPVRIVMVERQSPLAVAEHQGQELAQ